MRQFIMNDLVQRPHLHE